MKHPSSVITSWTLGAATLLCAAHARAASPPRYLLTELPPLGGTLSRALAVSNTGIVGGESRFPGQTYEVATAWINGQPIFLTGTGQSLARAEAVGDDGMVLGTSDSLGIAAFRAVPPSVPAARMPELGVRYGDASGLNAGGDVVGQWSTPQSAGTHPFLVHQGQFTALPILAGGTQGRANAISGNGIIVGYSDSAATNFQRAVRWDGGVPAEMVSNASVTVAYGVNNDGWAVGYTSGAPAVRYVAVLWTSARTRIDLGVLGTSDYRHIAYGINNSRQIVGTSNGHAFLWESGVMRDLNSMIAPGMGLTLTTAYAVSENGLIVGEGQHAGQTRAFLLTPRCPADFDNGTGTGTPDGGVTIDDLLYYLGIFAQGLPNADVDDGTGTGTPDGGVTVDDLLYYLARFTAGC